MPTLEELNIKEIVEANTDDRGRLYIGTDYANQECRVAILEQE